MGKRKISIDKIEDQSRRDVTFSKRRRGLFNKAKEFNVLCGAKVAVIVFSRAGKLFLPPDLPEVDEVLERYNNQQSVSLTDSIVIYNHEAASNTSIHADKCVEPERQETTVSNQEGGNWWDKIDIDEIQSEAELQDLYSRLIKEKEQRMNQFDQLSDQMPSTGSQVDQKLIVAEEQGMNQIDQLSNQMSSTASQVDQELIIMGGEDSSQVKVPLYFTNEAPGDRDGAGIDDFDWKMFVNDAIKKDDENMDELLARFY